MAATEDIIREEANGTLSFGDYTLPEKHKKEDFMTNREAIDSLKKIKTYTAAGLLDVIEYLIKVLEKLEKEGVTDPLNTDFKKLKN